MTLDVRDTSVRKNAEDHLAQMEPRYRGLLEAAPDAVVVVNQASEIVLVNSQAERQFRYGRDELLGQHVKTIIPSGFAERLLSDGARTTAEALAQQIGTGLELVARRKDGSEFPIELMLSPLESAEGVLVTATIRDISRRKAAERHLARREGARQVVDEQLRISKEGYRLLLDGIQDYAVFMMDPRGRVVSWNAGAQRIKGYRADEIIGQSFSRFFPPEEIERGRPEAILRLTEENGRHQEEGLRVRKDGSQFLASLTFTALRDTNGALRGFSEFSHDLSQKRELEARYRGLLEAAPDAMVVVDARGEIVLLNVQAEKRFGYRSNELLGQPVKSIIPEGFAERLVSDGTRTAAEALAQQIGTGIELSARRKDGSLFPIEIMLSPLTSAGGVLVTAAIRDITVRKAAEAHLARMEAWHRGLLEAAPDAMVLVNQAGTIVLANLQAEKAFGYARDELVARGPWSLVSEESGERLIAFTVRSVDGTYGQQSPTGIEIDGLRRDGSTFPIEVMLSRLESADGLLLTVAIRDITLRKRAERQLLDKVEELKRSNEELGQFAYIASHDLQEPLRMVASFTELLARRYKGRLDADADEFIAFAVDGANRMRRLIQDLLAYSHVGTRGANLVATPSEEVLAEAIANLGGAIADSGAVVTHDSLPSVLVDRSQLIQLFQNLVGNAIKYQRPGIPHVHVSAAKQGPARWLFSVQDNGLGIEAKYFEKIFGMFQRLHKRDEFAGTGIGLPICRKIVQRHGGAISLESEPGRGSTFRFDLAASGATS